ncbi:aminopeptidase [Terribacillus saccharophilus]|uniref:aminopeptidase n=1 Tax=Terribacillus saccharophilus TaxID=361277 RepID=UPI000C9A91E1|nr:aminopeptidase [Terribacillus goriensis]MEC0281831.1 aminopeptidase [Terribacillus saccharophilus]MEC0291380.1 aminopeptidase [Terribacillus saccharophilus]
MQFEQKLEKYAELLLHIGLNVKQGQDLMIVADLAAAPFTKVVAQKAYEAGLRDVIVDYQDDNITKAKVKLAKEDDLDYYTPFRGRVYEELAAADTAFLELKTPNPSLFEGIDSARVARYTKAMGAARQGYQAHKTNGRVNWLIASVPTVEWAESVFPDSKGQAAIDKLWDAIFFTTRSDQENTVELWEQHVAAMKKNADHLNARDYRKLHYTGPGTDLTIELHPDSFWTCAEFMKEDGSTYIPNLPTEEVFTIPVKTGVNGTVSSTKPLNYAGTLLENFSLTFENGKVVDFTAEKGYETLKNLLETDEGAQFLGEVALVPHQSPISQSGIVFNNTLFDENASCHLALGQAIGMCVKDARNKSKEELMEIGFNYSLTHVDFMVGSGELSITGETPDGTTEAIFENGNWAF